jgi:hypothetical protein
LLIAKLLDGAVLGGALVLILETLANLGPETLLPMDRGGDLMGWITLIPFIPKALHHVLGQTGAGSGGGVAL